MTDRATCHYVTPKFSCEMPAEHHLLVDADACSWACSEHLERALSKLQPLDHHTQGEFCWMTTAEFPSLRWHMSTPEHEGWCYLEDDELERNKEVLTVTEWA